MPLSLKSSPKKQQQSKFKFVPKPTEVIAPEPATPDESLFDSITTDNLEVREKNSRVIEFAAELSRELSREYRMNHNRIIA